MTYVTQAGRQRKNDGEKNHVPGCISIFCTHRRTQSADISSTNKPQITVAKGGELTQPLRTWVYESHCQRSAPFL